VKDASFISGHAGLRVNDPSMPPGPDFIADIFAPTTTTEKRAAYSGGLTRGYTSTVGDGFVGIDPFNDPYLEAEYDAGQGAMFRDVGDNERAMWLKMILPEWNTLYSYAGFVNAFSFRQDGEFEEYLENEEHVFLLKWYLTPVDPGNENLDYALASVIFTGEIAFVLDDPLDSIFSPNTKFYIGVEFKTDTNFQVSGWGGDPNGIFQISTNQASLSGSSSKIPTEYPSEDFCKYVIRLESGDISCPMYLFDLTTGSLWGYIAGESFVHKATEWWPYNRLAEPRAIWDAATGEFVPVGSLFAAFDIEENQDQVFNLI
jgi:hypothetical protein